MQMLPTYAPRACARFSHWLARQGWRPFNRADRGRSLAEQESHRSRSAFVQEMLSRNPDAFSSDLDVQMMMSLFPDRY